MQERVADRTAEPLVREPQAGQLEHHQRAAAIASGRAGKLRRESDLEAATIQQTRERVAEREPLEPCVRAVHAAFGAFDSVAQLAGDDGDTEHDADAHHSPDRRGIGRREHEPERAE